MKGEKEHLFKPQHANYRGKPLCQGTEHRLNNSLTVKNETQATYPLVAAVSLCPVY